jgi:hypothetical protein
VANPANRIKADEIKNHKWILGNASVPKETTNVLNKMREWNTKRKMEIEKNQVKVEGGDDKEFCD